MLAPCSPGGACRRQSTSFLSSSRKANIASIFTWLLRCAKVGANATVGVYPPCQRHPDVLDAFSAGDSKTMLLNAIDTLCDTSKLGSLRLGKTMGLDVAAVASVAALVNGALDVRICAATCTNT